ncbi:glycosyltransferase family 2 protein [Enterococcus raffinosus]|uniref:glycosyltransferase family 2 protein n=1 Tax=Enterococcus raffinosus TaxID=71452 RepID=UPI0007643355|nr:glycosyltransferase family 2 protein [Enterococcus raffinosus]OJG86648.1 glycosyltransferase, group 2 family protein [Enterococcus raffinosus]
MCEISIIVPVYNVEKYIRKCIDSILNQTFRDFELILVDDGSPDNSGAICDQYAKKDSRIRVIHKENGGLSSARNAGIEVAQGKYLGFVDSDDYIAEDMYELLHNNIIKEGADLSICGIYDVYKQKTPKVLPEFRKVCTKDEMIKMILEAKLVSVHAVNKLYKRDLFKMIRYPVGIITEDAAIIFQVLDQCKKIIVDTNQKYFYFHRDESISSKNFSPRDLDTIKVWKTNEEWISKKYPLFKTEVHTRVCWANFIVLDKLVLSDKSGESKNISKSIRKFLLNNFSFIMSNDRLTKGRKISLLFLLFGTTMYKLPVKYQYNLLKAKN